MINEVEKTNSVDFTQHIRTLKKGKWVIILMTLVFLGIGVFVASISTPIYKATTKLKADPQQPNANKNEQYIASSLVFLFYNTQYEVIKSRVIAERVVDELNLVQEYKENKKSNKHKQKKTMTQEYIDKIKSLIFQEATKTPAQLTDNEIKVLLATSIQNKLQVNGGQKSQIINISYESPDPKKAAAVINAISKAYIQFGLESRLIEVKNTENWLIKQSAALKNKLQESEINLRNFRNKEKLVNSSQQESDTRIMLSNLNTQFVEAQTNLSYLEEQFKLLKSTNYDESNSEMHNVLTKELEKEESIALQNIKTLTQRYKEKHPKLINARQKLAGIRANLKRETSNVISNIENKYKLASLQVRNIKTLIENTKNNLQTLQASNSSLMSLEREVSNNRQIYESFITQLTVSNVRSDFTASNIQIIDSATIPKHPIKPNIQIIVLLATFMGAFMGLVLVFVKEAIGNTFKTPDAIEDKLKLPSLGITPVVKKTKQSPIPEKQYLGDSMSPFAESINTIRTGLLFSNIDNPPKTILVTSATGSEGKSTMAMNLAAAFSNLGRTLLLEVDLRKPSVAKNLNIESKQGLTDLIAGTVTTFSDIVHKDNNDQLSVITCGTLARNPLELLSSSKFEQTLALLTKQFDHIILDGPPTLPVSDSCILANKVDGVIFAVKAEDTRIKVAKEAVDRLQKLNANIIGAVLTVAEPNKMSYYGDHYYSGEYYGTKPAKDA